MLEVLLNHFRSYGMIDLEFIIVNSKLSHAQQKLHELQKRVSFQVYQETDEEEVWSVMEGGKDDMFIYDRCGRLTYFVPFPLSMLNESPIVSNAILATYFRSPCGITCDQNRSLEIDEFVRKLENDYENSANVENITESVTEENATATDLSLNETLVEPDDVNQNESVSNDIIYDMRLEDEFSEMNDSFNSNITDYDSIDNETLQRNDNNDTNVKPTVSFLNSLYNFFNFDYNNKENETASIDAYIKNFSNNHSSAELSKNYLNNGTDHSHHEHEQGVEKLKETKKSDRCAEADYAVCKSWSKRRLLHAQKCCSANPEHHLNTDDERACKNFGKRRCKKIQSLLKCCIKTEYTEISATISDANTNEILTADLTETTIIETTESPDVSTITVVTCCKEVNGAKLCRASVSGACEEGEYEISSQNEHK